MDINNIGKYEDEHYSFEPKNRFLFVILPLNSFTTFNNFTLNKAKRDLEYNESFNPIRDDVYNKMEISLGPMTDKSDECLVESLLSKFNPHAKLNTSIFRGKIQ